MKDPVIPDGLLTLQRGSKVPLMEQIYRSLRDAVRSGLYVPGTRLPSTRRLATSLGVGRNTVSAAYDLLQAEGVIRLSSGAAPRVAAELVPDGAQEPAATSEDGPLLSRRGSLVTQDLRNGGIADQHLAFQPGAPALDCFPYEEWAWCLRRAARQERGADLLYRNYSGHPALKAQLSRHLAVERGVRALPEQILITSSMQASLNLFSNALADPGDAAWLEEPGYLGARTAFHVAGLEILPLPTDGQGGDASRMAGQKRHPKLIYTTPSHHFPLGGRMPLARRLALIEAARSRGAVILEDDYDSEFLFSGRPVAALYGLAEEGRAIYLSTFSKSLMPGLRVAYCVVPSRLVKPLSQSVRNLGCSANVQVQAALALFMDSGAYQKHLKQIRRIYEDRGKRLVQTLQRRLGNRVEVTPPTGNVQVAVAFRDKIDDVAIAQAMEARGFSVSPLSKYYLTPAARPGLMIGFAGASDRQIATGVEMLAGIVDKAAHAD